MRDDQEDSFARVALWCRREGIAWTTLTVGDVTIVGSDTRTGRLEPAKRIEPDARPRSIREQYGPPPEAMARADARTTAVVDEGSM